MKKLEQQVINKALSGDKNAFDMLFRAYYSTLYLIALDILHDTDESKEAVQDVFIKI